LGIHNVEIVLKSVELNALYNLGCFIFHTLDLMTDSMEMLL